jgi:YfiR/HmsC-like
MAGGSNDSSFGRDRAMRNGEGSRQGARAFLVALVLLFFAPLAYAQASASPEEVKAAFLFRFAAFVDWPAQAKTDEGFVFGMVAAPDVEAELRRYASLRPIGQQQAQVRRLESPADLAGVHVLFIGARDAARLARWIDAARARPVSS